MTARGDAEENDIGALETRTDGKTSLAAGTQNGLQRKLKSHCHVLTASMWVGRKQPQRRDPCRRDSDLCHPGTITEELMASEELMYSPGPQAPALGPQAPHSGRWALLFTSSLELNNGS